MPNLRPDRAARALIEQLRGRNFMLCSVGGRSYAFVHRTFLEYFCALEIRERFQTDQTLTVGQLKMEIFAHWADESWQEVLCLLAGMIAPRFVAEVLEYLLQQPDPQQTFRAIFLAARCLGEVRKRNELNSIADEILDRVKELGHFYENLSSQEENELKARVISIRTRAVSMVAQVWRDAQDTRAWLKARAQTAEGNSLASYEQAGRAAKRQSRSQLRASARDFAAAGR
jgi:predicted NACHT family NTPase